YMGPVPPAGQWVRLVVPARSGDGVAMEGHSAIGMEFMHTGGEVFWDYSGKLESSLNSNADDTKACTATPRFTTIPRHYWMSSVEWCSSQMNSAGHPWLGYGS